MRVLGSSVLALEAIVVLLAIPIAVNNENVNAGLALVIGVAIALLMLVTIGFISRPIAVPIGWTLQVLTVGTGFVVPTMFIVGGVFACLWYFAVKNGQKIDRARELGESPT